MLSIKSPALFVRSFLSVLTLVIGMTASGQQKDIYADSLKKRLATATSDIEKTTWMMELASYYVNVDNKAANDYASQAIQIATLTRDRKFIIKIYLRNADRYLSNSSFADNLQLAKENIDQAEKMARENGLDDELAFCYTYLSRAARFNGEYDKALNYNNLALALAGSSKNDSLKIVAYTSLGNTYRAKNEQMLAFRNYLQALTIAEVSHNDKLLKIAHLRLVDFYAGIEEYDKAIDYQMKIMAYDRKMNDRYNVLDDLNNTGKLFTAKKQYDVALKLYEDAIKLADSLQFEIYKINSYLNIANMYFANGENMKGLAYINSHQSVLDFFKTSDMHFFLDQGYGGIYTELDKLDSAYFYLKRAEPEIEQRANRMYKYGFYEQFGDYYLKKNDLPNSIAYYLKAREIGEVSGNLEILQATSNSLDSLYRQTGDFKKAYYYNTEYNKYKDSLKVLAKATDLLKLEVDADNRRRDRQLKEEQEETNHRHNVQYMGITAGIAALFIIMVMLGFFVVSPRTIRVLGFFSFIFLFEFIILLADTQIHEWTHGEPWKVMGIKIFLVAILLPLHHWLEHKVIHYLNSRKKLVPNSISFFGPLFRKKAKPAPVQET